MKRIENGKITLEASKRAMDFKNKAPEEITDLVIYYVDTFLLCEYNVWKCRCRGWWKYCFRTYKRNYE